MVSEKLAKDLPLVQGDRIHTAAGYGLFDHQRRRSKEHKLLIRSVKTKSGSVLVAVCNSGPGVNPEKSRAHLSRMLRHEGRRFGNGPIDLPRDHCGAWRTTVGD
jgi:hypothetical protein